MTNYDSDGSTDNEWDEPGDLAWREIDWELYLQEQDRAVREYIDLYDSLSGHPERLDEVARRMGWEPPPPDDAPAAASEPESAEDDDDVEWEPYTLHRNPVYIATRALYLSLSKTWAQLATDPAVVTPSLGVAMLATLGRAYEQGLLATQALDLGDYGLALCLYKRALRELNTAFAHLGNGDAGAPQALATYRDFALPRLFDLREVWLRVMHECRIEFGTDEDSESRE